MSTRKATRRARRSVPSGASPGRVRKNMDMDPSKLRAAQDALGARTETETVDRALDLVLGRARFDTALDRITAQGGFEAYDAGR
jgi:hypothetical protein